MVAIVTEMITSLPLRTVLVVHEGDFYKEGMCTFYDHWAKRANVEGDYTEKVMCVVFKIQLSLPEAMNLSISP